MSKVIVMPGTVIGRAHANHPVDEKGEPDVQAFVDDVTLTIHPATAILQSGEIRVLCDELHTDDFPRDSAVEVIVAPQGWKAQVDALSLGDAMVSATEIQTVMTAKQALAEQLDKATETLKANGDKIHSLESQLTVVTKRAESAEGVVATRDGEITVLKAELTRLQNAIATAKPSETAKAPEATKQA